MLKLAVGRVMAQRARQASFELQDGHFPADNGSQSPPVAVGRGPRLKTTGRVKFGKETGDQFGADTANYERHIESILKIQRFFRVSCCERAAECLESNLVSTHPHVLVAGQQRSHRTPSLARLSQGRTDIP